jgi:hypothetical protein
MTTVSAWSVSTSASVVELLITHEMEAVHLCVEGVTNCEGEEMVFLGPIDRVPDEGITRSLCASSTPDGVKNLTLGRCGPRLQMI